MGGRPGAAGSVRCGEDDGSVGVVFPIKKHVAHPMLFAVPDSLVIQHEAKLQLDELDVEIDAEILRESLFE